MDDPTPTPAPAVAPAIQRKPALLSIQGPATRDVLAVMSTGLVVAAYFVPWVWGMPKDGAQYVGQMQGAVLVQWAGVMSWYFGASKGSAQKDDTIAAMASKAADQ